MAPTGAADGLGEAAGALGGGLADPPDDGVAPLELQATRARARTVRRA
jgi:hypothetical protein